MPRKKSTLVQAEDESIASVPMTRPSRRRLQIRMGLLKAAHEVFSVRGVDAATIQEITQKADIGFGTFYNYFKSKDEVAAAVLDCMINDLGRRNDLATATFKESEPALVQAVSYRLTVRVAVTDPMWQWWSLRPDLLADRMYASFKPFAVRDICRAIRAGVYPFKEQDADAIWGQMVWLMVGGLRDMLLGNRPSDHDLLTTELLMRMLGITAAQAQKMVAYPLPPYPLSKIDFSYDIASDPNMSHHRGVSNDPPHCDGQNG